MFESVNLLYNDSCCLKGVLDLLANRCLAQGTNAWTDTDHTCYTMETAGSEGFLNLLPIYLDHILYPTLTVSNVKSVICLIYLITENKNKSFSNWWGG